MSLSRLYGINFFDGNFFHHRLIIATILGVLEQIVAFYQIYNNRNNLANLCALLAIEVFGVNIVIRTIGRFYYNYDRMAEDMIIKITKFFESVEQNSKFSEILNERLKFSNVVMKYGLVLWFLLFSSANFAPCVVSWYTGEFILIVPIFLPWIDPHTLSGYILDCFILYYFILYVYVIFMSCDMNYVFLTLQTIPMVDIYCMKLNDLGEKLVKLKIEKPKVKVVQPTTSKASEVQEKIESAESEKEMKQELINLIKDFNKYQEYLQLVFDYIEMPTFFMLSMNATAIGLSALAFLYYSKVVGVFLIIVLTFQVFVPCAQGTVIAQQKEKVLNALWDFPFYELSLKNQKIYLQFMHLVQNSKDFEILIVGNLEMETFTSIANAAYSSVLVLKNTLK